MENYNETWENIVNSFTTIIDNIFKYEDYYYKTLRVNIPATTLQSYCFYIIDFYEFGIMYDIDKVIFQDDNDEQLFKDELSDLCEAMFELSKTLNLIDTDNGEIVLKPIFNKFEKYVYTLSRGMDDEDLKEVFKEIWGLFSLIHERLNPNNDDQNAQIMARKYKQIIEEYDYKEAVEEYKELHYRDEILSFDKVGYYFNYLYCIMVKFEKWLKDILPFYKIDFNDIVVSKIDDNRQNDDDEQTPQLPPKLNTTEAMRIWKKAQEAGLVDEHYNFKLSNTQRADFAYMFSDKLNFSDKERWKHFEKFWNCANMAQDYLKFTGQKEYTNKHAKIKKLFE